VWTADDLAQQLRIDPAWVDAQLRAMVTCCVMTPGDASQAPLPAQFRFEPRTPEVAATVEELARTYAERRVSVIGLIFAKPTEKLRSFADAFRIRKDRSD
jgi:hypothetical protein